MFAIALGLWSYLYWYIRPALKWFLRKTTRLCELQRICYGEEFGYLRSSKIGELLFKNYTSKLEFHIMQ